MQKCSSKGTLIHCLWECDHIKKIWIRVKKLIEKIIAKPIKLDSKLFILALYPDRHIFSKAECTFLDLSLLVAKRCIALNWKNMNGHGPSQWLKQMSAGLPLERITYIHKLKQHKFEKIWGPFIEFINDLDAWKDLTEP